MDHTYSAELSALTGARVMDMSWEQLTFIHWPYDPSVVQALLPEGLTVDTFDGQAWVGLVPFRIVIRPAGLPSIPWLSRFPETNVRTYVRTADGKPGVWFLSLDAARLAAVAVARMSYRIPYFWASMSIHESTDAVTYTSRRRWPKPAGPRCYARVQVGSVIQPTELTQLDYFLTARSTLFSAQRRGLWQASLFHEPWPLRAATLTALDEDVIEAAGLPSPVGEPHVRYAADIGVAIGLPRPVAT